MNIAKPKWRLSLTMPFLDIVKYDHFSEREPNKYYEIRSSCILHNL